MFTLKVHSMGSIQGWKPIRNFTQHVVGSGKFSSAMLESEVDYLFEDHRELVSELLLHPKLIKICHQSSYSEGQRVSRCCCVLSLSVVTSTALRINEDSFLMRRQSCAS